MRHILAIAVLCGCISSGLLCQGAVAIERPNIILILADDFGYECVGANGGTSYPTPHLDQLAATGVRFEHCFVQPLCTPTRVQLMTGQYNIRNYIGFGVLKDDQTTFAHLFQRAGYKTAVTGKWQLQGGFEGPRHFGFDEYCLWQLTRRPPRYANPGLEINGKAIDYSGGKYGPDIVNDYALDFIGKNKDRPFMLYYPMMLTHGPFQPTPDSPDWDPTAEGESVNQHKRHFGEMTTYMDKLIGKLVAALSEHGLREKTLILFVGDNGTAGVVSQMGDREVKGEKGKPTERGMRVPLIANWPTRIPAGRVCRDLVDSTDFLPTICQAAEVAVPAGLTVDGHSFWPQLQGERGQPRDWIYSWYAPRDTTTVDAEFAANDRYKLYRDGRFVEWLRGSAEQPVDQGHLSTDAEQARQLLKGALDQFRDARPAGLNAAAPEKKKAKRAAKKKKSA